MPEYSFAFFSHIDTFPLELFASWATLPLGLLLPLELYIDTFPLRLCLIDIVCFDNAGIHMPLGLLLPLGLFCLFGLYIDT
jgi:hypothetical protein